MGVWYANITRFFEIGLQQRNKKIYLLLILSNKFVSRLVIIFTPIVI